MEITDVEVMIVNRVREIRSIPPSPFSIGAGVKERETRGPGRQGLFRGRSCGELLNTFNSTQSSGFSLGFVGVLIRADSIA